MVKHPYKPIAAELATDGVQAPGALHSEGAVDIEDTPGSLVPAGAEAAAKFGAASAAEFADVPVPRAPIPGVRGVEPITQLTPSSIAQAETARALDAALVEERLGMPPEARLVPALAAPGVVPLQALLRHPDFEVRARAAEALVAARAGAPDAGLKGRAARDLARERDRRL